MTVRELADYLYSLSDRQEAEVTVSGYEGGIVIVTPRHVKVGDMILNENKGLDFYGDHEYLESGQYYWRDEDEKERKPRVPTVLIDRTTT